MRNKAYSIATYSFSINERILIDANVWYYLFPPPSDSQKLISKSYSRGFIEMIRACSVPVLDPLILSEYLNRYCRFEWQANFCSKYPIYKKFRNSSDFNPIVSSAAVFASDILKKCELHSIPSNQLNLHTAIADFKTGEIDFNDAVLADICKQQNIKLLTNDGDFQKGGIEVITSNPQLLRSCP